MLSVDQQLLPLVMIRAAAASQHVLPEEADDVPLLAQSVPRAAPHEHLKASHAGWLLQCKPPTHALAASTACDACSEPIICTMSVCLYRQPSFLAAHECTACKRSQHAKLWRQWMSCTLDAVSTKERSLIICLRAACWLVAAAAVACCSLAKARQHLPGSQHVAQDVASKADQAKCMCWPLNEHSQYLAAWC